MVKCNKCSKEAVVKLHYNKTDLCGNCFCDQFENRVKNANKEFKLIELNQKIAVGISGGKDSAAMLYILHKIVEKVHGTTLQPILIDEGILGYRNEAIKKAQALCEKLGLELKVFSYRDGFKLTMDEIMDLKKANPKAGFERSCTYCGVFRKTLLNKAALEMKADTLAIGHNLDDIAQTFLMNMFHNEPERLKRFDVINDEVEGFVPRIKPLIYNPEKEVALYCELKRLPYFRGECPYSNESFRGEIKNFLNNLEQKFPGVKFNLLRAYLSMRGELQKAVEFDKMFPNNGKKKGNNGKNGNKQELENSQKIAEMIVNAGSFSIAKQKDADLQTTGKPTSTITKCKNCGQNSSTQLCKACSFVIEIGRKKMETEGQNRAIGGKQKKSIKKFD